jgi:hypothetical protein
VATYAGLASVTITLFILSTIITIFNHRGSAQPLLINRAFKTRPYMGRSGLHKDRAAARAAR